MWQVNRTIILCLILFGSLRQSLCASTERKAPAVLEDNKVINEKRIINGVFAPKHRYRWAALIKGKLPHSKKIRYCSGAIINENYIMTAAHCFDGVNVHGDKMTNPHFWNIQTGNVKVFLGHGNHPSQIILDPKRPFSLHNSFMHHIHPKRRNWQSKPEYRVLHSHAQYIHIHPRYDKKTRMFDIALMQLNMPLPLATTPTIQAIQLPQATGLVKPHIFPPSNLHCIVIGWGSVTPHGPVTSKARLATLKTISYTDCRTWHNRKDITNKVNQFCAGHPYGNKGVSPGDDGAILACPFNGVWTAAGVVSNILHKHHEQYPAIFTRIQSHLAWIIKIAFPDCTTTETTPVNTTTTFTTKTPIINMTTFPPETTTTMMTYPTDKTRPSTPTTQVTDAPTTTTFSTTNDTTTTTEETTTTFIPTSNTTTENSITYPGTTAPTTTPLTTTQATPTPPTPPPPPPPTQAEPTTPTETIYPA